MAFLKFLKPNRQPPYLYTPPITPFLQSRYTVFPPPTPPPPFRRAPSWAQSRGSPYPPPSGGWGEGYRTPAEGSESASSAATLAAPPPPRSPASWRPSGISFPPKTRPTRSPTNFSEKRLTTSCSSKLRFLFCRNWSIFTDRNLKRIVRADSYYDGVVDATPGAAMHSIDNIYRLFTHARTSRCVCGCVCMNDGYAPAQCDLPPPRS